MTTTDTLLDRKQTEYKTAVDHWRAAIAHEEKLASGLHSAAAIDTWEAAHFAEEKARFEARAAKVAYEDALRKKLFNF